LTHPHSGRAIETRSRRAAGRGAKSGVGGQNSLAATIANNDEEKVRFYCYGNPNTPVLDAIKNVLGLDK
jgi:hypothetical protein